MDPAHDELLTELHAACTSGRPLSRESLVLVGDILRQNSDARAFDILVVGYREDLTKHALRRGLTLADAEEVVQLALFELYCDHRTILGSVRGWLFRTVRNMSVDNGRRRQRRRRREARWVTESEIDSSSDAQPMLGRTEVLTGTGLTLAEEKALNEVRVIAGEEDYLFLIDCHSMQSSTGTRTSWTKLLEKYGGTTKELRHRYQALTRRIARHTRGHLPDDDSD